MRSELSRDRVSYRADYLAVLPEARALAAAELVCPKTDVDSAVAGVLAKLPRLAALRARVAALPELDLHAYDQLGPRARALSFADSRCRARVSAAADMAPLARELTEQRRALRVECAVLAHLGVLPAAAGAKLQRRGTRAAQALQVREVALVVLAHWPRVAPHTRLTERALSRAVARMEHLHGRFVLHAAQRRAPSPEVGVRTRIFTLLYRSLAEVQAALAYLLRRDPAQLAASLPRCHPRGRSPRALPRRQVARHRSPSRQVREGGLHGTRDPLSATARPR